MNKACLHNFLFAALITFGVAAIVAGWWYVRNWLLYGDPLALSAMFSVGPQRTEPASVGEIVAALPGVWRSFWAVFGWFNVVVAEWVYWLYSLLAALGTAGWIALWLRARKGRTAGCVSWTAAALLLVWIAAVALSAARWAQINFAQGRLLFPAIAAIAALLAGGLLAWWPRRWQRAVTLAIGGGMALLAALIPFVWIAPVYTPPAALPAGAAIPNPVAVPFGDKLRLVGYELGADMARPGDAVDLTLYWQIDAPTPTDFSVFVHATDETDILQAQEDSYPGGGLAPTSSWTPGATVEDRYRLRVPATVHAPSRLRIDVGVYDHATGERLATADGEAHTIGFVNVPPPASASGLPNATRIDFGGEIALVGYELDRRTLHPGATLGLTLWWEALRTPARDYKVFTHLLLPPAAVWAQDDQEPQEGAAPTSTWQPGARIEDHYLLTLPSEAPPGNYQIEIGIYDPDTLDRLRVGFSDKGVPLGWVSVVP